MKKRGLSCIISMLLCTVFIVESHIKVNAEELTEETQVYYDTEQGRVVIDLNEYLLQLNDGMITPYAPTIEEYDFENSLYTLSEPSKKCSNIFGHKWGEWGHWEEALVIHNRPSGPCLLYMQRKHKCERTFCGATQTETDSVFISTCHGNGN